MRKYYIDNLRWLTILLLVPYHAAMAFNVWAEPNYIFFESNRLISSIVVFFSPYFMPILFLLAGISTKFALQKRTAKQYISERAKKLLIPFVFGTLGLMPVMAFFADKFNCGYDGNLFQHYSVFFTKFTDLTGADGGFSVGQFWFILYLFVISVISVAIILLFQKCIKKPKTNFSLWLLVVLGMPLPLFSELLSIGGKSLLEYTYLFLLGYYVFSNDSVIEKFERFKGVFIAVGLAAAFLNVYLFIWCDTQHPLLNTAAKFAAEWFMLLGLLGAGKGWMNTKSKFTAYMSKRSFTFYIWHFIWVVLFQYFMADLLSDYIVLLYIIPVIFAYTATFACCEIIAGIKFVKRK